MAFTRGLPSEITVDNGPEFIWNALDQWATLHNVTLIFSRPGKPVDNAFVESFNGRFRDECLNASWFQTLSEAKTLINNDAGQFSSKTSDFVVDHRRSRAEPAPGVRTG